MGERRLRIDACGGAAVLRGGRRGRLDSPSVGKAAYLSVGRQSADPEARELSRHATVRTATGRHAAHRCRGVGAAPRTRHPAGFRPAARRHRQATRRRQRFRDHHHRGQSERAIPARNGGRIHRRPPGGTDTRDGLRSRRDHARRRSRRCGSGLDLLACLAPRGHRAQGRALPHVCDHGAGIMRWRHARPSPWTNAAPTG